MGSWGKALLVAALTLPALAPLAEAEDCPPELRIYGRAAPTPGVVPPAEPARPECTTRIAAYESLTHTLPPGTSQITMRLFGDMAERRLAVELDGLGWKQNKFYVERYETGGQVRYAGEWLYVPDPRAEEGVLRATMRLPHQADTTVEYRTFPLAAATTLGP